MATQYTYTELQAREIRILQLQPELNSALLQCSLEIVSLDDLKHKFNALSWTWGKPPKPEEYMDIKLDEERFSIWPSLYEALYVLRKYDKTLHLWVDAICINQEDPEEMKNQIPLMDVIYTSAYEVYVWLGGSANDSDYVMEVLRSNRKEYYNSDRFQIGHFEILLRPWWTRTWVVQEFVLNRNSPKVFCGHGAGVSAELLIDIWRQHASSREFSQYVYNRPADFQKIKSCYFLYHLRDSRHNSPHKYLSCDFRNALSWLRSFKATKSQDKVYGALGLIEPKWREQFMKKPGVHPNQSATEVYHSTTIYLLECEKTSTIFYDFPIGRQSNSVLPSWVPNFNIDTFSPIRLGDVTSNHLDTPRKDIQISKDGFRLTTQGLIVDCVNKLIPVGDMPFMRLNGDTNGQLINILCLLHQIQTLISGLPSYKECEVPCEPLWRTLIAGCYGSIEDEDLKDKQGCQICFEEWMAIPLDDITNYIMTAPLDEAGSNVIEAVNYVMKAPIAVRDLFMTIMNKSNEKPFIIYKIMQTLSTGRLFFSGEQGSYGISESGAQRGDIIALLFPDHFIPIILRKINNHFEMVSVAYIPKMLKEAIIENFKEDNYILQDFVIV